MSAIKEEVSEGKTFFSGVISEIIIGAIIMALILIIHFSSSFFLQEDNGTLLLGIGIAIIANRLGRCVYKWLINLKFQNNFQKSDYGRILIQLMTLVPFIYQFNLSIGSDGSGYLNFMIMIGFVAFISGALSLRRMNTLEERNDYFMGSDAILVMPKKAYIFCFLIYYVSCMSIFAILGKFFIA